MASTTVIRHALSLGDLAQSPLAPFIIDDLAKHDRDGDLGRRLPLHIPVPRHEPLPLSPEPSSSEGNVWVIEL